MRPDSPVQAQSIATGSVRMSYVQTLFDHLNAIDVDPAAVIGQERYGRLCAMDPGARLSIDEWQHVLARAVEHLGDETLPLKLGSSVTVRHLGLLGYLIMSCDTLADVVTILERYERLIDDLNDANAVVIGQSVHLEWRPATDLSPPAMIQNGSNPSAR